MTAIARAALLLPLLVALGLPLAFAASATTQVNSTHRSALLLPNSTTMAALLLPARHAAALDAELFKSFSLDTLMELAGLAVAQALYAAYPPARFPRLLVVAGPGNNGGDGLVAARHAAHFGYAPTVVYPRRGTKGDGARLFAQLTAQLDALGVPVLESLPPALAAAAAAELAAAVAEAAAGGAPVAPPQPPSAEELGFDVALDAVFGFSFGADGVRPPFDGVLAALRAVSEWDAVTTSAAEKVTVTVAAGPGGGPPQSLDVRHAAAVRRGAGGGSGGGIPIVSVDVPSGWDVDGGDVLPRAKGGGLRPSALVSLTAPKPCAAGLQPGAQHWLGGRFLPPALASKYGLAVAGSGGASAEATVGALGTTTAAAASEGAPAEGPALPAFPGSAQVVRLA